MTLNDLIARLSLAQLGSARLFHMAGQRLRNGLQVLSPDATGESDPSGLRVRFLRVLRNLGALNHWNPQADQTVSDQKKIEKNKKEKKKKKNATEKSDMLRDLCSGFSLSPLWPQFGALLSKLSLASASGRGEPGGGRGPRGEYTSSG